jgi:hypothetical protein
MEFRFLQFQKEMAVESSSAILDKVAVLDQRIGVHAMAEIQPPHKRCKSTGESKK